MITTAQQNQSTSQMSYLETLILAQEASSNSNTNDSGQQLKLGPHFLTSSPFLNGTNTSNISSISTSFLLNLANGSFISLPILDCSNMGRATTTETTATRSNSDICSINWTDIRLFGGSITNGLADLYPLDWTTTTSPPPTPTSVFEGGFEEQPTSSLHHYTRLTYLTLSSILSLAGVLTNLLTGLILLINTKQKFCNHFLSNRSSNTNHHYVLLSQLTLTGLLIASYVLVDSVQTFTNHNNNNNDNFDLKSETLAAAATSQFIRLNSAHQDYSRTRCDPNEARFCHEISLDLNYQNDLSQLISISSLLAPNLGPHSSESPIINNPLLKLEFKRQANRNKQTRTLDNNRRRVYLKVDPRDGREDITGAPSPSKLFDLSQILELIDVIPNIFSKQQFNNNGGGQHAVDPLELLVNLVGTIHIWTVAALAYDRYCAIAHPLQYLRSISTLKARVFLLILWLLALLLNIILPFAMFKLQSNNNNPYYPLAEHLNTNQSSSLIGQISDYHYSLSNNTDSSLDHHPYNELLDQAEQTTTTTTTLGTSIVLIIVSLISFVVVIVIPLIIVTICDISIYGIVKVHERRLSASSSSQGASSGCHVNINGTRYYKRHELIGGGDDTRSDTFSVASSILGKLVRASTQVGLLRSISRQDIHHVDVDDQHPEAYESCQLMLACQGCCCDSDHQSSNHQKQQQQQQANNFEASKLINRANKRQLVARQDSYSLMQKRQQQQQQLRCNIAKSTCENSNLLDTTSGKPTNEQTVPSTSTTTSNHIKLKRKMSDHRHHLSFAPSGGRKSSLTSQSDNFNLSLTKQPPNGQDTDFDPCHLATAKCLQSKQQTQYSDSEGIMHQLKMAGLSFAGIAINDSSSSSSTMNGNPAGASYQRRNHAHLNRSSSCSLGNLASMRPANQVIPNQYNQQQQQQQQQQQSAGSISRCSVETADSSQINSAGGQQNQSGGKRSTSSFSRRSQQSFHHDKPFHSGNLIDSVDFLAAMDNNQYTQHNNPTSTHTTPQHGQTNRLLPFTIGTKSISFNLVIWLVLSMLLVILPQCFLQITLQMLRLFSNDNSTRYSSHPSRILDDDFVQMYGQHLAMSNGQLPVESGLNRPYGTIYWMQSILGWLSCICRLLFMIMLSMNGWIYGIRSRSLKVALKLVLRRYISRRQASIEIDQRQKSSSSLRSRDSSYFNLPYCNHLVSAPFMANHHEQMESPNHCHCHRYHSQHQHHRQHHCNNNNILAGNHHQHQEALIKKFRRCSSFNGMERDATHSMHLAMINGNDQMVEFGSNVGKSSDHDTNRSDPSRANNGCRSHNNSIRFVLGDSELNAADFNSNADPPLNPSLTSSLAGSNKSLLAASIQSSVQSAAILLLDKRQLEQTGLFKGQHAADPIKAGANNTKLSGCLKKNHVEFGTDTLCNLEFGRRMSQKTPTRRRRLSSSTFIDRTSSLDRYDEQSESKDSNSNKSPQMRDQQRPNSSATGYLRQVGGGPLMDDKAEQQAGQLNLRGGHDEDTNLRKSSSEIKFLLTNVDQDEEESCVLNVDLPTRQPPETPEDRCLPTSMANQDRSGDCILVTDLNGRVVSNLVPAARGHQEPVVLGDDRTSNSLLADCYRQIKTKLSKYVTKSSSNDTRRTTEQQSGYFSGSQLTVCNSLPDSPGSCSTTTSSIVAVHLGNGPTRQSSLTSSNDVDSIDSGQCRNNDRLLFRKYSDSSTGTNQSAYEQRPVRGRVNVHRKSSLDSHYVNCLWRTSGGVNGGNSDDSTYRDLSSSNMKKTAIRNSMTSTNLVAKSINENRASSKPLCKHKSDHHLANLCDHHAKDHHNTSGSNASYQSGPHLKPPNFLKLMFDPEAHNGLYSSQLALSPIKECSSNHSYASSQSSLSNNQIVQLQQHQKQQEHSKQKQSDQQVHLVNGYADGSADNNDRQWKPSIVIGDSD